MAFKEFEAFTKVVCAWEDASSEASDTFETPESMLASFKPCIRRTIGYYVGRAKQSRREAIVLAMDDDRTPDTPLALGGVHYIPVGLVISVEAIVPSRRRR